VFTMDDQLNVIIWMNVWNYVLRRKKNYATDDEAEKAKIDMRKYNEQL
jgi:hypothetical protein